jgi:hypothetical protein
MGVTGFILMVSGLNSSMKSPKSNRSQNVPDLSPVLLDRQRIKEDLDIGRLDEPAAKI